MTSYKTVTVWQEEHLGRLRCSNGAEMDFSAPPALHGLAGLLTPEDAVVGALNMCFQLMFLWAAERYRLVLASYECEAEGFVEEHLDRTSTFARFVLRPRIAVREADERRVHRALESAYKYSLVAQSLKAPVAVEPAITLLPLG